jgi:hypothetical protein
MLLPTTVFSFAFPFLVISTSVTEHLQLPTLQARGNSGCTLTCRQKDDGMTTWGNWDGCSSPQLGSGTLVQKDDEWHGGMIWAQDKCWTEFV